MKLVYLALATAWLATGCSSVPSTSQPLAASDIRQPEGSAGRSAQPGWQGERFAVATAHPLASEAGVEMLRAGGTAIDAAVAAQMVLGLVEPQSSGIGGGAFLLYHDGHQTLAFDGRETAPAAVDEKLFLGPDGTPMAFDQAIIGGRAVGVPGAVRMLEMAHAEYGRLPWASLFEPAIRLALHGFPVGVRLHTLLQTDPHLRKDAPAAAYFYDRDGQPPAVGSLLRNPELAGTLRRIASQGSRALHEGEIAQAIVDKVRQHADNPGKLSLADLAAYQPRRRTPMCSGYAPKGVEPPRNYLVCGFPPPGSGAIAIAQILGMLEHGEGAARSLTDPRWMHDYTEAARLAFADRAQYVADPDFVAAPTGNWLALISPDYLAVRARLIGAQSMQVATPGSPSPDRSSHSPMPEQAEHGTSHLSVVDGQGNALAMTSTIEDAFGARQMVKGFLLNNQLSDFSFTPTVMALSDTPNDESHDRCPSPPTRLPQAREGSLVSRWCDFHGQDERGTPVANRVEPGKRPRSSMSPTLVFDQDSGELVLSGGSPGGALIIHYTAKLLYATLNRGLTPQQAIDLPNFGSLNGPTLLEEKRFAPSFVAALRARGHEVKEIGMSSGVQAIMKVPGGYLGGADPRREGQVLGE